MKSILSSTLKCLRLTSFKPVQIQSRRFFSEGIKVDPSKKSDSENQSLSKKEFTEVITNPTSNEIPVWMKPYDADKYEVPMKKVKYSTGYSLLEVEPLPRARILKIGFAILEKIKICPEDSIARMYTEEKIRYVMEITDATEDVQELERIFKVDAIELFIQSMIDDLTFVDHIYEEKPWEDDETDDTSDHEFFELASKPDAYYDDPRNIKEKRRRDAYLNEVAYIPEEEVKPKLEDVAQSIPKPKKLENKK